MSEIQRTGSFGRRSFAIAASAALILLLAACSSSPSASAPQSNGHCAVTPGASASATIGIAGRAFSGEATVKVGEALAFTNNDNTTHTITEGTGGVAVSGACVNEPLSGGSTLLVTFNQAGDYKITCTIHSNMQTVVHVQ
jgi:plastocyanin